MHNEPYCITLSKFCKLTPVLQFYEVVSIAKDYALGPISMDLPNDCIYYTTHLPFQCESG